MSGTWDNSFAGSSATTGGGSGFDYYGAIKLGSSALSSIGSAVQDLGAAAGSKQAAAGYRTAAALAGDNADLEMAATRIQQQQELRAVQRTVGQQQAEVAGAGLASSGSALQLLADSSRQGAITMALTGVQGQIAANGYTQQAQAYMQQAQAADNAAKAQKKGAMFSIIGAVADVAGIVAAPFTGGASLLAAGAVNAGLGAAKAAG